MKPLFLLAFFCLTSSISLQSQLITKLSGNRIQLENQIVKYKEADHIFKTNPEVYPYYTFSLTKYKSAKTFGILSISGLTMGMIGVANANTFNQIFGIGDSNDTSIMVGVVGLFVGALTGTLALTNQAKAVNYKNKTIDKFNNADISQLNQYDRIQFEMTLNNGIGFVMRF